MTVFAVHKSRGPWGDYSDVLAHGMTAHLGRRDGLLQLERTGLFVPPVTLPGPGDLVVTDAARIELDHLIANLAFRPVSKARIVRLEWHLWDLGADEPAWYPESGEPEGYVLDRLHDPGLAWEIGPLWELCPEIVPAIQANGAFAAAAYHGQPYVRAHEEGGVRFVSAALAEALRTVTDGSIALRAT